MSAPSWCANELRGGGDGLFRGALGLRENFSFGSDPVFEWVAGSAVALAIDFVSAKSDFVVRGQFEGGF